MTELTPVSVAVLGLLIVGVGAALMLSGVAWRRRDIPGSKSFLLFLGTAALYSGSTFAVMISPGPDVATGLYHVATVGGVAIGIVWVLFAIEYTGYWDSLEWWSHLAIWGLPAAYGVVILTNPWHGLVMSTEVTTYESLTLVSPTFNLLGILSMLYVLGLTLFSYGLLGHLFLRTRNVHRKQTGAILLGSLIPMVAYGIFLGGLGPHPALDLTPVAFALEAIVVGWALFRYDFLAVSPIATELYLQRMADPLLVLDERDRLVDFNDSAAAVLGLESTGTQPHVRSISPTLGRALGDDGGTVDLSTPDGPATFGLTETTIHDRHDRIRGTMIVLRDVTELEEHRAELQRKNAQLEQFTSVVSHDLRNPLNVAKGFAELARDEDDPTALERSIDAMGDMEALIEDLLTLAREDRPSVSSSSSPSAISSRLRGKRRRRAMRLWSLPTTRTSSVTPILIGSRSCSGICSATRSSTECPTTQAAQSQRRATIGVLTRDHQHHQPTRVPRSKRATRRRRGSP